MADTEEEQGLGLAAAEQGPGADESEDSAPA
jgi:hypothetical protein